MMITKTCSKCKCCLPLSKFHRYKRRSQTHYSQCKDCKAAYKRQNKNQLLCAQKKRRLNDITLPTKQKAWNKVYYALKTGKIEKLESCFMCGIVIGKDKIQAHHNDYSKPFDIIWCCQDCHVKLGKLKREVI